MLLFFLLAYLFISGFDGERNPDKPTEELNKEENKYNNSLSDIEINK